MEVQNRFDGEDDADEKVPRICLRGAAGSVHTVGAPPIEQILGTFEKLNVFNYDHVGLVYHY